MLCPDRIKCTFLIWGEVGIPKMFLSQNLLSPAGRIFPWNFLPISYFGKAVCFSRKFSSEQWLKIPQFQQCWSVLLHNILSLGISVVSLPFFSRNHYYSFRTSLRLFNTSQQRSHFLLEVCVTGIKTKCILTICDYHWLLSVTTNLTFSFTPHQW